MALEIIFDSENSGTPAADLESDALREANHRIANMLAMLGGGVRLQATNAAKQPKFTGNEVRLLLAGISARIDAAARLHNWLSERAIETDVDFGDHLRRLCAALEPFASLVAPLEVLCQVKGNCTVRSEQVIPLALIVTEMITNAIKYAHPGGAPGAIVVYGSGDETFTMIEIADNGVGLPENFDPKTDGKLGFQLVRSLAKQLGATLVFDTDSLGLRFQIFVPQARLDTGSASVGEDVAIVPAGEIQLSARRQESKAG